VVLGDHKPLPPNNPTYAVVSFVTKSNLEVFRIPIEATAFQHLFGLAADHDFIATMMVTDRSTMSLAAVLKKREL
jgi:hypothetical protein